ncbi:M23 family metallopeptidase [bacterium]|nr:M23 family metallopeptidase [bacterium]
MENRKLRKSAVYLIYSVGFVLLVGVAYLIEGLFTSNQLEEDTNYVNDTIFDEVVPVVASEKKIARPYKDGEVTILKDYYDYQADETTQEKSIIVYQNTYLQSSGVSYGGKEEFDITAVLDGKVISVEDDETLGTTVKIEHENNIVSIYQSLKDVAVKVGDQVSQGDIIAKAGTNNLSKDFGNHLYFELIINGQTVDPENYYDKNLNEL